MFQSIEIKVNEESLAIGSNISKSITGEIYFDIGGKIFPELRWNDFVVIILTWWIQSLSKLMISDIGTTCEFQFMDGPFVVRGMKAEDNIVDLEFVQQKFKNEKKFFKVRCSIEQFKNSLMFTSRKVIKLIKKKKWDTKEIRELSSIIETIRKTIG